MSKGPQPQKTDVSGTGPAGKPGVKQHCSNYGGDAGRIAAMGAFAHCVGNLEMTHPPSPLPFAWGEWEGADKLGDVTQGSPESLRGNHWALGHNLFEIEDGRANRGDEVPRWARSE